MSPNAKVSDGAKMQTTTISSFRFEGAPAQLWAFSQMQFARAPLKRTPGVSFCKLMGSGTGESFHPRPNFGVYAILLIWQSNEAAIKGLAESKVIAGYRSRATESFTVFLQAHKAWGQWDGGMPFETAGKGEREVQPIGVLTRATLHKGVLYDFWKSVPAVSDELKNEPGLLFKLGMGEVPWVQQVTFSIWRNTKDMHAFAYRSRAHSDAIRQARERGWFKEGLFARFSIVGAEGTWEGRSPIIETEKVL